MLLWQAIRMSMEHPIVGVGPGVFGDFAWDERKANLGVGGGLLVSHNTYTQFSAKRGYRGSVFRGDTAPEHQVRPIRLPAQPGTGSFNRPRQPLYVRLPHWFGGGDFLSECGVRDAAGSTIWLGCFFKYDGLVENPVEQTALTRPEPVLDAPRTLENRPKMQSNFLNGRRVRFGRFAGRGAAPSRSRPG